MKDAVCIVSISPLRAEASDKAEMVSQLLFGDCVQVIDISHPWAEIKVNDDSYSGFVDYKHLLSLSPKELRRWNEALDFVYVRELALKNDQDEVIHIPRGSRIPAGESEFNIEKQNFTVDLEANPANFSIPNLAMSYLNTPYLWGGKSPFGIDCSGLTQMVFRLAGYNLPRDAYEQVDCGNEVEFNEIQAGDLAFFINSQNKVHHVGIILDEYKIIHASGHVRIDELRELGIYRADKDEITHKLYRIMRL